MNTGFLMFGLIFFFHLIIFFIIIDVMNLRYFYSCTQMFPIHLTKMNGR